jgi:hypothetical protein
MSIEYGLLRVAADVLDDLERSRIANENRLRQLLHDGDGGYGLSIGDPQVVPIATVVDGLAKLEHQAVLALQRELRKHPLGPWVKRTVGVGEKQGARLIAAIGDPYWNTLYDRPRTVSELWAFCGLHVLRASQAPDDTHKRPAGAAINIRPGHEQTVAHEPLAGSEQSSPGGDSDQSATVTQARTVGVAPRRTKGQRANWSTAAKTRAYLVAESCIKKANSPYRAEYDRGRAKYAESTHALDCPRCGPKGKPADIGSPLSAGHQHARAMRLVSKAILRDLWIESAVLHATPEVINTMAEELLVGAA